MQSQPMAVASLTSNAELVGVRAGVRRVLQTHTAALLATLCASAVLTSLPAAASEQAPDTNTESTKVAQSARLQTYQLNIPAQDLNGALQQLALASQHKLFYKAELVEGKTAPALNGDYTAEQAIQKLLTGTNLGYEITPSAVVLIKDKSKAGVTSKATTSYQSDRVGGEIRLAQNDPTQSPTPRERSSAPSASAESTVGVTLEEVIVTAEKRAESLSRTALAVTALGQDVLDQQNVTGVTGLNGLVPNLTVSSAAGEPNPTFTIRGITTNNWTELGNPAIAFHVDGVYVGRPASLSQMVYDVDRIEILRGPQGTLYGKSATSGAINVITARPTMDEFYGKADASYGNYDQLTLRGMVNVPLSDTFAVRMSAISDRNDGVQRTRNTGDPRHSKTDQLGGRLSALWEPAENLSWFVSLDYFRDTGAPSYAVEVTRPAAAGLDVWNRQLSFADGYVNNKQTSLRSNLNWTLSDSLSLSYVAGYALIDRGFGVGYDVTSNTGSWGDGTDLIGVTENDSYSHEVNLHFGNDSRLHGIIGAFLFHEKAHDVDWIFNIPAFDLTLHFPILGATEQESRAAFAQTTYDVTEKLHVTAGVRQTKDDLSTVGFFTYACPYGTPLSQAATACTSVDNSREDSWKKTTWRLAVDYQASDDNFLYGSVSTGYKPGGFGDFGTPAYQPETVINYEVGLKSRLFGNTVSLNNALFYMDYSDLQVSTGQVNPETGLDQVFTDNAATATIYGFESEYEWLITSRDRLSGYIAMMHATYDDYIAAPDTFVDQSAFVDLQGKHLSNTPEFSQQLRYEHTFDLAGGARIVPSANVYWQSAAYLRNYNLGVDRQEAYSRTNLTLAYHAPDDRWQVEAFVANLENKYVKQTLTSGGAEGDLIATYMPPRTYGIRFGIDF